MGSTPVGDAISHDTPAVIGRRFLFYPNILPLVELETKKTRRGKQSVTRLSKILRSSCHLAGGSGLLNQFLEGFGIRDRQIGQPLAVNFNTALGKTVDQPAIFEIQGTACRVDTNSPETAVNALLLLAAFVHIGHRAIGRAICHTDKLATVSAETAGHAQNSLAALARRNG